MNSTSAAQQAERQGDGVSAVAGNHALRIAPVAAIVFLGLMAMGLPLAVLPVHIHEGLGFDTLTVGWVMGLESVATLLSRKWTGRVCDRHGPRAAMLLGLLAASLSGAAYLLSYLLPVPAVAAVVILALGRVAMGVGEGLIFTSGSAWPVALLGMANAGKALAWIGVAMFGGIAAGTAFGTLLGDVGGFSAMAWATAIVPLIGLVIAWLAPAVRMEPGEPLPLRQVVKLIWRSGAGFLLSSVGYAAVSSFLVLNFAQKGWDHGGYALATFGLGYVASRIFFGGRADAASGPGMAVATLSVQALGLVIIWLAPHPWVAFAGAGITGLGISMVYPLLALPAIKRVPPANLGIALGVYDACFDVALMVATPLCGALAAVAPISAVFLPAAAAAMFAIIFAVAAYRNADQ